MDSKFALCSEIKESYGIRLAESFNAEQLLEIHGDIRLGGISLPQVKESIKYACVGDTCEQSEFIDVLQEMDRRYFLVQDLRWEFSMLDTNSSDTITEEQAKWLVQMVHGEFFSKHKWENFLRLRPVPGSGVTFAEIEVLLCNIPSLAELLEEERNERQEELERMKKKHLLESKLEEERERKRKQQELERRRLEEEERRRKKEEERRLQEEMEEREKRQREKDAAEERRRRLEEEEERGRKEAAEREERKRRLQNEMEEKHRKEAEALREAEERKKREEELSRQRELQEAADYERLYQEAKKEENEALQEADGHKSRAEKAEEEKLRKEAEESEKRARLKWREARNRRIRYNLKVSIKKRDEQRLPVAVNDFKRAKLPDDDMDLAKAEKILKEWQARDRLTGAMKRRMLEELEKAINFVKRNGFEFLLQHELIQANRILLQLRRLERIRAEILELKQSTVAEIRSYQKPPLVVHQVMTGTFVLLGHKEREIKDWKQVQIWVGKTGKEGLKRRCLELDPGDIPVPVAHHAKKLLSDFDLDDVRDVSAGAATFYAWSWTMIEELEAREVMKQEEMEQRKKREEAKKRDEETMRQQMEKQEGEKDEPRGEADGQD